MIFWLVFISFFPPFGIEIWYLILFPYSHLWPLSHYMVLDLYWSTSCNCVRLRGRNCLYLFYVRITVYVMCSFLFGLVFLPLVKRLETWESRRGEAVVSGFCLRGDNLVKSFWGLCVASLYLSSWQFTLSLSFWGTWLCLCLTSLLFILSFIWHLLSLR